MGIEETIPLQSVQIRLHCGRGVARVSRDGWSVEFGNPYEPPLVRFGQDQYSYVDGRLVPCRLLEEKSQGRASIQVGVEHQPAEDRTGWNMDLPLLPHQCAIIEYSDYCAAFNVAASPTILWKGREFRVFDELLDCPPSTLGINDIGKMIDGKGVLVAPRIQLRDFSGHPVGPLLNYFAAPQSLGQIHEKFNNLSGKQITQAIPELKNVYGHDGVEIANIYDLMNAAMCDVSQLGKWHLAPLELLAGRSCSDANISNPHHMMGMLDQKVSDVHWPHGRYVALVESDYSNGMAFNSSSRRTARLVATAWTKGWLADDNVSALLVRAEPA